MKVAIVTTVSRRTPWADIVLPGRVTYCIRHGYSQITVACDYEAAHTELLHLTKHLLGRFDLVWMLGADCLITNHTLRIEEVPGLGPHMSICEEGLGTHALVNGDAMVWRATDGSVSLIDEILAAEAEWRQMTFLIQDWLGHHKGRLADRMTVMHSRAFNSVHNGDTLNWKPGDFVYHPCGAPPVTRCEALQIMSARVVR